MYFRFNLFTLTVLYFVAFVSSNFSIKTGDKIVYYKPPATFGDISAIAIAAVIKVMPGDWPVLLSIGHTIPSIHMVKKVVPGFPDLPPPITSSSDSDDAIPNSPGFRPLEEYHLVFGGNGNAVSPHRAIGKAFHKSLRERIAKMRRETIRDGGIFFDDFFNRISAK